jgi:ankyrin repeat protein
VLLGLPRVVEWLITTCALDANPLGNSTPLYLASEYGMFAVVQVLLMIKHGSDVNAVTRNGWTPLHSSSRYRHLEAARLLLDHGAEVNSKTTGGETALHMVSGEGNLELA